MPVTHTHLNTNLGDSTDLSPNSLSQHGSLQDKKRKRLCLRLVTAFICVALLVAIAFSARLLWGLLVTDNPRLLLKNIQFKDTHFYSASVTDGHVSIATVLSEAGIEINKSHLLQIDLDQVQNLLKKHPLLGNIRIAKIMPDTLSIDAIEYTPEALLVVQDPRSGTHRFPITVQQNETTVAVPQLPVLLLPNKLELYQESTHSTIPWNYALYPEPFNKHILNNTLPCLFNFKHLGGELKPGSVIHDKLLTAAIKLIRLTGITSANKYFIIQQITCQDSEPVLRMLVSPQPTSRKIRPQAQFDFLADNISEQHIDDIFAFLAAIEANPESKNIMYLNATSGIYACPTPP